MAVTPTQVSPLPAFFPAPGLKSALQRASQWVKAPAFNFSEASGAALSLIELPGNAIIVSGLIHVATAFDASGTSTRATAVLSVPVDSGAEIIWNSDSVAMQSSGFYTSTGVACKTPASGGFATLSYTPATTTAGQMEVYLEIIQLADQL